MKSPTYWIRLSATRWLIACLCLACAPPRGPAQRSSNPKPIAGAVRVDTVASKLANPWGLELLPDGRMLVTERPGRLRIVSRDGKVSEPLAGVPPVFASGQGGLLDVALDPEFASNNVIYLSYAEPGTGGAAGTSVARATLGATGLSDLRVIYRQEPKMTGGNHFGSRIVFARDGTMWITQGERFNYRDQAQNLNSDLGKIVRINRDGTIPRDNPFVGRSGVRPEIWSYGHRNVQAAAMNPETGQLWTVEHGAAGGDELNHPEAGKNYGWPVITYGRDYNGRRIGEGAVKEGMEQPVYYWDPVIAPSGMTFYTGDKFAGWKGSIFVGGLASMALVRLVVENGHVVTEERYLHELGERIRDVRQGDDGYLYLITDSGSGRLLRVRPKSDTSM
jgi:aldose sugar dehydrogenase